MSLCIITEDVPIRDVLQLPIPIGQELPEKLLGCTFHSTQFECLYLVTALDDTRYGFALATGLVPLVTTPFIVKATVGRIGKLALLNRRGRRIPALAGKSNGH